MLSLNFHVTDVILMYVSKKSGDYFKLLRAHFVICVYVKNEKLDTLFNYHVAFNSHGEN